MRSTLRAGFTDRLEAGRLLGQQLKRRPLRDPLVLAIPRGGVATGLALAEELGAELDVVLSRKLRAPYQPEYAIGAISEDGHLLLDAHAAAACEADEAYLEREKRHQLAEIARRAKLFRTVRPQASLSGRSVIVTDDGIATGSTMIAALQTARAKEPHELIMAVPVAPPQRLRVLRRLCDDAVCLLSPESFRAVGEFYEDFSELNDDEAVALLRRASRPDESDVSRAV